ncbi:hypothetical protein ASD37_07495 [Mycobacterium sp. Root135]|uniref:3-hydroxyacyl-CoA dehydrogenase NAD-binding domain-containing protein n=1 Tax=Mycobacterium sp. Root135 TaxID=1736457 RepID=UPI000701FC5E|nr:3-hydroxyacyl-CoA dehydrogenase NAD-binding domain-containing protein [Mycobacterium sp. Root135]KQY07829.1 hypothetical protein ASD37_07495 [Mycobacterium sp. Root135]
MTVTTGQSATVSYDVVDTVAVVRLDNPPVNASTAQLRAEIIAAVSRAGADPEAAAVVLIGNDAAFVSGSDLREFDSPELPEPQLPQVISAIEDCVKPVVAALSGVALGGGLELALGCDARLGTATVTVGLPEVTLGMIPGAGGTQRLPRLIGVAATIDLVCSGKRLTGTQARDMGILDAVCPPERALLDFAVGYAKNVATKRVLIRLDTPTGEPGAIESAAAAATRAYGVRPQVLAAIGSTMLAASASARTALNHERHEFHRLRLGREARALRHLFFAERASGRTYRDVAATQIQTVGVVGAGTMGAGIARTFVDKGFDVTLVEIDQDRLDGGLRRLRQGYERGVARGQISADDAQQRLARVTPTTRYADLQACDLVVEAVFEDFDVKTQVLRQISDVVQPHTVIATNTSYLDIEELARSIDDPHRMIGMHFFSPAHATKVLEVVRGPSTDAATVAAVVAVGRGVGKTPVVAGNAFGFIGNRIFNAYRQQCELMLEEGALPHQIDAALEDFGFAMGPFAVADLAGLDIAWRMRRTRAAARDPRLRYVDVADRLCEQGRLGQKAGLGWYRYAPGSVVRLRDSAVEDLVVAESERKGIARQGFTDAEIVRRALVAMANEADLILAEQIAERASDIDLMMVLGYGFPRHRGGPAFWAQHEEVEVLQTELVALRDATGPTYRIGDMTHLLAR